MDPLVSVLIASYNAGEYLKPSLMSIFEQSYKRLEVILIDDGSTDGSIESITGLTDVRLQIIRQPNCGKPCALNAALDIMSGELFAIHDADDLSHPLRIERQVSRLMAEPDLAAVFCGHELILNGRRLAPRFRSKDRRACQADIEAFRMPAHDPTGMYRRSAVKDARFDSQLPIVEGYDYILRVGEEYPMVVLGECLYCYRIHCESVTKRDPDRRDQLYREVLRRACDRRGLQFAALFPERVSRNDNRHRDNGLATDFIESVVDLRKAGRIPEAIRTGLSCACLHPFDPHYYKALLYAVTPQPIRRRLRPSERKRSRHAAVS